MTADPAGPPAGLDGQPASRPVVLVGFMGAGKSTVGPLLAARLGRVFLDSDVEIAADAGRSIPQIFAADGEAVFRDLEHQTVRRLLTRVGVVLAVGGGALSDARTRLALRSADVIDLHVGYRAALARTGDDPHRPMLARPDLAAVYASRLADYAAVARLSVDTDGRSPAEVLDLVLTALRGGPRPG